MESNTENIHHYYVDEAGCMTLFNNKGKSIIGNPGVSKVFMVGVAHVPKPDVAKEYLDVLRKDLLEDAYFKGVPSMQPSAKKTASCFHACKDVAEVRYHVFKLLPRLKVKVQIVIRRKRDLIELLKKQYHTFRRNEIENYVYDDLVKRIFRNLLHKADENKSCLPGKVNRREPMHWLLQSTKRSVILNKSIIFYQIAQRKLFHHFQESSLAYKLSTTIYGLCRGFTNVEKIDSSICYQTITD